MKISTENISELYEMSDGLFAIKSQVFIDARTVVEGYFYIDTGSNVNLINSSFVSFRRMIPGNVEVGGIGETPISLKRCHVNIGTKHHNSAHHIICYMVDSTDEWADGVIGLLGYKYLKQHRLIVDFGRKMLYLKQKGTISTCEINENYLCTSLCDLGDEDLPILCFSDNDGLKNYDCIIDSGADTNIISQHSLIDGQLNYSILSCKKKVIAGMGRCIESVPSIVEIIISGYAKRNGNHQYRHFSEAFEVGLSRNNLLPSAKFGKIDALLGIDFLKKNDCIIDCESSLLYIK